MPVWRRELWVSAAIGVAGLLAGVLAGAPLAGLALALLWLLLRHYRFLYALWRWAEAPKRHELPEAGGLWGAVLDRLLDMRRANRKRKKRLARIVAEFQASTAALPDAAVVLGSGGQIVWFNTAARELLGLRSPQDYGQRISNLLRHPAFSEYLRRARFDRDVEIPSPVNRRRTLSIRIVPYGEGQRLLIARDVSDLRRAELARRQFVANASHELRTPLTVLRGYLDMMAAEAGSGGALAGWAQPVEEMRRSVARMETLVRDMLELARLEAGAGAGRDELVDMGAVLSESLDAARKLSSGRHRIEADIARDVGLLGHASELRSIADNLLSNAVRYTPDGGRITLHWGAADGGAVLEVSDDGIGIPEADIPRITERFYRVDVGRSRDSGGTGLGLAIVKHALEAHDGVLEVSSRLGHGSRFVCRFPASRVRRLEARGAP